MTLQGGQLRDDKSIMDVGSESGQPDWFSLSAVTPLPLLLHLHFLLPQSFQALNKLNCDLMFDRISLIEMLWDSAVTGGL